MSGTVFQGWLLFDAGCVKCVRLAYWLEPGLNRRGYLIAPLQEPWVGRCLSLDVAELLKEVRLLTASGRLYGGAEVVAVLAGMFSWGMPIRWLTRWPAGRRGLDKLYRWLASRRGCDGGECALRTVHSSSKGG
jgi:predicted DCC family thiol-disulfide oxidoreductase YuxK